jgi:hypothetical protein
MSNNPLVNQRRQEARPRLIIIDEVGEIYGRARDNMVWRCVWSSTLVPGRRLYLACPKGTTLSTMVYVIPDPYVAADCQFEFVCNLEDYKKQT